MLLGVSFLAWGTWKSLSLQCRVAWSKCLELPSYKRQPFKWLWSLVGSSFKPASEGPQEPREKKSLPLSSHFVPLYFAPTAAPNPHPRGCVICDSQTLSPTLPPDSATSLRRSIFLTHRSSPPWRFVLLSMFLSTLLLSFSWQHLCPTLGSWSPSGLLSWVINFSSFGCPHAFQKLLSSLLKRTLTPTQHVKWTHTPLKPGNWPRSPLVFLPHYNCWIGRLHWLAPLNSPSRMSVQTDFCPSDIIWICLNNWCNTYFTFKSIPQTNFFFQKKKMLFIWLC